MCISFGLFFLILSMGILIIDESILEFGLETGMISIYHLCLLLHASVIKLANFGSESVRIFCSGLKLACENVCLTPKLHNVLLMGHVTKHCSSYIFRLQKTKSVFKHLFQKKKHILLVFSLTTLSISKYPKFFLYGILSLWVSNKSAEVCFEAIFSRGKKAKNILCSGIRIDSTILHSEQKCNNLALLLRRQKLKVITSFSLCLKNILSLEKTLKPTASC